MQEKDLTYIKEVLTEENEHFRLTELGFFSGIEKECRLYCREFPRKNDETLTEWEYRTLRMYYRMKGFSQFCRNSISDEKFERLVRHLMKVQLRKLLKEKGRTETDRYLAPDDESISFSMSEIRFQELYALNFYKFPSFGYPEELDGFCRKIINSSFPIPEERIAEDLSSSGPAASPGDFPSHGFRFSNYIDCDDEKSLQGYFIVILYNTEHPLHRTLIGGEEDKVERLFEHYVNGISYENLVIRHHGRSRGLDLKRKAAQMRQETRRLKKKLWDRYEELLKEYR